MCGVSRLELAPPASIGVLSGGSTREGPFGTSGQPHPQLECLQFSKAAKLSKKQQPWPCRVTGRSWTVLGSRGGKPRGR